MSKFLLFFFSIFIFSACNQSTQIQDDSKVLNNEKTESLEYQLNEFFAQTEFQNEEKIAEFIEKHRFNELALKQVHNLVFKNEDPTLRPHDFYNVFAKMFWNQKLYLTVNNNTFGFETLFRCSTISKYECFGVYADDTAHITEFPPYQIIDFQADDRVKISFLKPYNIKNIVVDPVAFDSEHIDSKADQNALKIPMDQEGFLDFSSLPFEKEFIFFIIFHDQQTNEYFKPVWIIRKNK